MNINVAYTEITNRCNLNCMTCYNRSGLNSERSELSVRQVKEIIDTLIPFGLKRFLLAGGEPTLHSEFDEILDLVFLYPELSFGIVTNGTVHNQKLIDLCNTRDDFSIQVSIDGSGDEQNAKTRGVGNFKISADFLTKLKKSKNKPLVKMVVSQYNVDDVENFYRFVVSNNGVPEYAFVNKMGNGFENWDKMKITAQQKLKALKQIDRLNNEYNIKAMLPMCTSSCPLASDPASHELSVAIKFDGSMQPCQLLYDDYFTLANVLAFDYDQFTTALHKVSSLARERVEKNYGCDRCIIREKCEKGCMATAFDVNRDPLDCDDGCDYRKLQFVGYDLKNLL